MTARRIFLVVALLFSASALAYLPPATYVTEKWIKKTRGVRTLQIRQRTTLYDSSFPEGRAAINEEIRIRKPGYFRKTSEYPRGVVETFLGPKRAVRIVNGKTDVIAPVDAIGPLGVLFTYADQRQFLAVLRQAEIDIEKTAWDLSGSQVGYSIGERNRILFAKEIWTPIRATFKDRIYRFDTSITSRFPGSYPEVIEVMEDGKLVERTEVLSVKINPKFPKNVFDPETARTQPAKR